MTNNNDVYVADHAGYGLNLYIVMVNGKAHTELICRDRLTWSEQWDIAAGYKESLDTIGAGMVGSPND